MKPKELLSSMHQKTYFKGGQTIKLGKGLQNNVSFMKRKDIQNRFKEIQINLNHMAPEEKEIKEIEAVRFNHLKLSSRREGDKHFLSQHSR